MSERTYHGNIVPADMATALIAAFNQGNMRCQQVGQGDKLMVQIATREHAQSGGQGALSVTIQRNTDGVTVGVGQQQWLGVAASLGQTALATLMMSSMLSVRNKPSFQSRRPPCTGVLPRSPPS